MQSIYVARRIQYEIIGTDAVLTLPSLLSSCVYESRFALNSSLCVLKVFTDIFQPILCTMFFEQTRKQLYWISDDPPLWMIRHRQRVSLNCSWGSGISSITESKKGHLIIKACRCKNKIKPSLYLVPRQMHRKLWEVWCYECRDGPVAGNRLARTS